MPTSAACLHAGLRKVKWQVSARRQLLVFIAPLNVTLNVCKPPRTCEPSRLPTRRRTNLPAGSVVLPRHAVLLFPLLLTHTEA